jgi:hypothetical protein
MILTDITSSVGLSTQAAPSTLFSIHRISCYGANVQRAGADYYRDLIVLKTALTVWATSFGLLSQENGRLRPTPWVMDSICAAFSIWEFGVTRDNIQLPPIWRPQKTRFTLTLNTRTGRSPDQLETDLLSSLGRFDEGIKFWIADYTEAIRELERREGLVPVREKRHGDHYE